MTCERHCGKEGGGWGNGDDRRGWRDGDTKWCKPFHSFFLKCSVRRRMWSMFFLLSWKEKEIWTHGTTRTDHEQRDIMSVRVLFFPSFLSAFPPFLLERVVVARRQCTTLRHRMIERSNDDDYLWLTLKQTHCWEDPTVQFAFKDSMIHRILQFTWLITFCCALLRLGNQGIQC
jgi:hypothetical protein